MNDTNNYNLPNLEELEDSIMGKSHDIETICLSCGFTENVPDIIYDETSRKKYHLKINTRVSSITCGKCFKEAAISSYWLKN